MQYKRLYAIALIAALTLLFAVFRTNTRAEGPAARQEIGGQPTGRVIDATPLPTRQPHPDRAAFAPNRVLVKFRPGVPWRAALRQRTGAPDDGAVLAGRDVGSA